MMKKKTAILFLALLMSVLVFAGCGKNNAADNSSEGTQQSVVSPSSPADASDDDADDASDGAAEDAADDVGDAAEDLVEGAEDAADDVADGVGDAIDNLGGGSFDSYADAKDYLLEKLHKDNKAASYELREETEELTAYNSNDSGAEGYKFSVYETDGGEKIGIYYVDKDTGKIYRYMGKNSIEGY